MGAPDWVDVFPIRNGDVIPASYVISLPESKYHQLAGANHTENQLPPFARQLGSEKWPSRAAHLLITIRTNQVKIRWTFPGYINLPQRLFIFFPEK